MTPAVVEVRPAHESDATAISEIYGPYVRDTAISFEIDPPSPDTMKQRIAHTLSTYPWLVARCGAEIVGFAYAGRHRDRTAYQWTVDLAIYVSRDRRRRGVGRALYVPLLNTLRLQGFRSALAEIVLPNPGSVRLHESLEFTHIGTYADAGFKLGHWHNIGYWRLGLSSGSPPEGPPRPFRVFRGTPAFASVLRQSTGLDAIHQTTPLASSEQSHRPG